MIIFLLFFDEKLNVLIRKVLCGEKCNHRAFLLKQQCKNSSFSFIMAGTTKNSIHSF